MVETAATVWADGPAGDPYWPEKYRIRTWGAWIESFLNAIGGTGGFVFGTRSELFASLSPPANSMAWVVDDPVGANNGIYRKLGASGIGSWVRVLDLPYSFVIGSDVGAGTANAVKITTDIPVSDGMIVAFRLFRDANPAPVTVSINNGPPLTLKSNRGADVTGLTAGMDIWFRIRSSDGTGRMLNDQNVSALVEAAAQEFVALTQQYRDEAANSAQESQQHSNDSAASAAEAQLYAELVGAAVFDFNFDSDPTLPGYDWND
jgi:hypothetical protein